MAGREGRLRHRSRTRRGETRFVAALETTDEDQARESIDAILSRGLRPLRGRRVRGRDLHLGSGRRVPARRLRRPRRARASRRLRGLRRRVGGRQPGAPATSSPKASTSSGTKGSPRSSSTSSSSRPRFARGRRGARAGQGHRARVLRERHRHVGRASPPGTRSTSTTSTPLFEGQPEAGASALLGTAPGDALGAFAIETIGAFGPPDRRSPRARQRSRRRARRLPRGGARSLLRGPRRRRRSTKLRRHSATRACGSAASCPTPSRSRARSRSRTPRPRPP